MTPEKISNAMDGLDSAYLEEALSHPHVAAKRIRAKRLFLRLGSLAACFCLIFSGVLISCSKATRLLLMDGTNRANQLMEFIHQNKDNADSYTVQRQISMSASYDGNLYNTNATSKTVYCNQQSPEQFVTVTKTEIETLINQVNQMTEKILYGYQDGKMFQSTYRKPAYQRLSGASVKLPEEAKMWSYLTREEYTAHVNAYRDYFGLSFDPNECTSKSCVQEKDKTWTATFSGFSDKEMSRFESILVAMEDLTMCTYTLADVSIRVKADENFYPQTVDTVFIFQKNADLSDASIESPQLIVTSEYSDFNGVLENPRQNLSEYREVDDLRLPDILDKALAARRGAPQWIMRLIEGLRIQSAVGTENESYSESKSTQTIQSIHANGIYKRHSISIYPSYPDIVHANVRENGIYKGKEYNVKTGKITREVNDVNTEDSETQGWLRERQGTLILHGGTFDRFNVSDVEVIDAGNGVYKITVNNPGYGDYATKINRGWRVTEVEAYILFVIRDGKLIQCTYEHGCWAEELMAGKTHHVHYNTAIFAEDISEFDFEFPLPEDWSWE